MPKLRVSSSHFDDPFGAVSPRYFLTPELNQRLNLIRHLIQNSEQLLLVLAKNGYGKTSLLKQLKKVASKQDEHWWIYNFVSEPTLSPDSLFATVLAAFNIKQNGKPMPVLQESLRSHIAATRYNGQLPVLFVDDAHKLPLVTLKSIIELAMQGEPLTRMRVILFCEPQITSILAAPEFKIVQNNMVHTLDIPNFSPTQVRDYLQFRLRGTKYADIHPFTSDVIKKISAKSEGVPFNVNRYAQQILHQFEEPHHEPTLNRSPFYPKLPWGIPMVLVLICIALLIYWKYLTPIGNNNLQPIDMSFPTGSSPSTLYDHVPLTPTRQTTDTGAIPQNLTDLSTDAANFTGSGLRPENNAISPTPSVDLTSTTQIGQTEVRGEKWLRNQNPNAYTLQILGVHERITLRKFLLQYELDDIAMFKTTHSGKSWYVLVYGVYPTRQQALAALETLPPSLRQDTKPWARSIASVQKHIK